MRLRTVIFHFINQSVIYNPPMSQINMFNAAVASSTYQVIKVAQQELAM